MRTLAELNETFINKAREPFVKGILPVQPKEGFLPVIAMNTWKKSENYYIKKFEFRVQSHRNEFIKQLLEYEDEVGHNAKMIIDEGTTLLMLQTKTLERVTEIDKEYSKYADAVYKDVVLIPE